MKLTRKGRQARALLILLGVSLALWLFVEISRSLWWVGIDAPTADLFGYCWGEMARCFEL
jgi:hypothetical protein